MKKCIICNKELDGSKTKYCSNNCKAKAHYRNKKNENSYHSQTIRGLNRKIKLIELKGNKCKGCGYNKNIAALEFNHIGLKNFPLDIRNLSNRKWEDLLKEVEKCELLCSNCHKEYHNPELILENVLKILQDNPLNVKKCKTLSCLNCKIDFRKVTGKKFCSKTCREKYKIIKINE